MDRAKEGFSSLNNFTTSIDISKKIFLKQCNAPSYLNIPPPYCYRRSCHKLNLKPVVLANTCLH